MRKVTVSQAIDSLATIQDTMNIISTDTVPDTKTQQITNLAIGVLEQFIYNKIDYTQQLLEAELRSVKLEKRLLELGIEEKDPLFVVNHLIPQDKRHAGVGLVDLEEEDTLSLRYPDVNLID